MRLTLENSYYSGASEKCHGNEPVVTVTRALVDVLFGACVSAGLEGATRKRVVTLRNVFLVLLLTASRSSRFGIAFVFWFFFFA